MKLQLVGLFVLLVGCAVAQVKHVTGTDKIDGDFYYALPKTAIVMDFTITTTTYTKGDDFLDDSQFYKAGAPANGKAIFLRTFGIDPKIYDAVKSLAAGGETKRYKLSPVKISAGARRDATKIYSVKASKSFLKHNTLTFAYGDDGVLLSGELASESQVFDAVIKGISGIASIVSALKGPVVSGATLADEVSILKSLMENYDNVILNQVQPNLDTYKDKKSILEDRISDEFGRLFYSTEAKTEAVSIAFIPAADDKATITDIQIFSFDKNSGTLTTNNAITAKLKVLTTYTYSSNSVTNGHSIAINADAESLSGSMTARPDKSTGFAYNVSLPSTVVYKNAGTVKDVQYLKIAQYGVVAYLNPGQKKTSFELDPLTGDLKKITGETSSITGDNVSSATTSATDLIKLIKGDDEKTKLQSEFDKLDLKKKIKDLKAAGIE